MSVHKASPIQKSGSLEAPQMQCHIVALCNAYARHYSLSCIFWCWYWSWL